MGQKKRLEFCDKIKRLFQAEYGEDATKLFILYFLNHRARCRGKTIVSLRHSIRTVCAAGTPTREEIINSGLDINYLFEGNIYTIYFDKKEDAILFKLLYGDTGLFNVMIDFEIMYQRLTQIDS